MVMKMPQFQTFDLSPEINKLVMLQMLLLVGLIGGGWCLNLSYPSFSREGDFTRTGDAFIVNKQLQVSPDVRGSNSNFSGRAVYKNPIKLWNKGRVASFNSTFVLNVAPVSDPPGDGLAFLLTKEASVSEYSIDLWLGLFNADTNGSSSTGIVAVEFDTKKSFTEDLDNNHVGLNINSINSCKQASLNSSGLIIANGTDLTAMILYDGVKKTMNISVFHGKLIGAEPPVLSISHLNLNQHLSRLVYVGFSASTGLVSTERNTIREWYFTIDDLEEDSEMPWWVWVVISVSIVVFFCGVGGYLYCQRETGSSDRYNLPIFLGVGPKKFKLKDLKAATGNFDQKNELGRGGFGIVFKATLEGQLVAVKRIKNTPKGMQNLIAEVTTIGSLHHKNLVELIGWCYEGDELLLVYEYMHNRSLDTLLYCNDANSRKETDDNDIKLSWNKRYNIICGVAQALDYLHNECSKRVLHRDIKASNIMLDSEFNARLGDFGLARMFNLSEKTHHSTQEIAGTPGYMAPELFLTGKATTETDVFAFGVLALVLVTGRKTGFRDEQGESCDNIIDWVWKLYSSKLLMNATDPKLKENCDERQAKCILLLGLACCHSNPSIRPSINYVIQVLIGEASLPEVPLNKPAFVWPAPSASTVHENSASGGMFTLSSLGGR